MENIELQADVFRLIRRYSDKTEGFIIKKLAEEFPDEKWADVVQAANDLASMVDNQSD